MFTFLPYRSLSLCCIYCVCVFCDLYLIVGGSWYVDNCGREKLVDDLSPSQFDLLVCVLYHPTTKWDFKTLLTLESIRDVIEHPEDFVS